jgi:opine dehydrogenase
MGDISANAVFQKTSTAPNVSALESRLATIAESQRLIAELLNSRTACVSPAAGIAIPKLRAHDDKSILSTGIVGMGNSAHALAAYLSAAGCSVRMLTRHKVKAEHLDSSRQIYSEDRILGRFELAGAYTDARAFASRCKNIFVATVATAYRDVAASLAPHLNSDHTIILFSGKFGGAREFQLELIDKGLKDLPKIVETDSLFACRLVAPGRVWIRGIKRWTLFSSVTRSETQACAPLVNAYFPGLAPADNLVQRGLTDFGALAHAPIALTNMHAIDREEEFLFYYQGMTPKTVAILEQMEEEFKSIAEAYECELIPMKDLLNRYYGCDTTSLYSAMTTVPNYRHSLSPKSLHHRFFYEDVACSLVPFEQLAKLAAKETPILSSMISLATCVVGEDFRKTGRTLENLKLGDFNQSEIIQLLHS